MMPSLPKSLVVLSPRYLDDIYGADFLEKIRSLTTLLAPPLSAEEVLQRPDLLAEVEVIFSGWNAPVFDDALLKKTGRLRAIFYAAGSVRYFVTDGLWQRGITVCSSYALNGEAVADYTVGAALFALKQGFAHAQAARRGAFAVNLAVPGVHGATVGLISLGATGLAVARKLVPFGVRLICYDPYFPRTDSSALGLELWNTLEAVFAEAEVVSLHTPFLPETAGMITGAHFRSMRSGATFINTARGEVVREAEMIAALQERTDLTAILDVTDPEPPVPGSPLYQLPNVVLTPHVAGAVKRERRRMGEAMLAEYERWHRGEPLRHQIQPAMLARMA